MESSRRCLRAPVAILIAVLATSLVACGGGGGGTKAARPKAPAGSSLKITAGPVDVQAAGAPGTLSDGDRNAIADALQRYVIAATITPLGGKPVGDLTKVFTAEAIASIAGPYGVAMIDSGMPKATTTVEAKAPPVPLTALSEPDGTINLVGAALFLDVRTKSATGPIRVQRNGELLFKRDAGTWKIASYKVTVNRTGAGLPAPTTSSTGTPAP